MCKLMANLCTFYTFSFSREALSPDDARNWELVNELAQGDDTALDKLITRWQRPILTFIHRQLAGKNPQGHGISDDAEDLAGEVFWRIYSIRKKVRGRGSFSAWIFRIAYNLCLDHLRKCRRESAKVYLEDLISKQTAAESQLTAPPSHQPNVAALNNELSEQLERAMSQLPETQRAALILARIEGLSYKEVSLVLGCSVASVESLLFRARQNLQKTLGPHLDGE